MGKDELLSSSALGVGHVHLSHSFELLESTFVHDYESAKRDLLGQAVKCKLRTLHVHDRGTKIRLCLQEEEVELTQ